MFSKSLLGLKQVGQLDQCEVKISSIPLKTTFCVHIHHKMTLLKVACFMAEKLLRPFWDEATTYGTFKKSYLHLVLSLKTTYTGLAPYMEAQVLCGLHNK